MSQDYRTIQFNFAGGLLSPMQEGSVGSNTYMAGLSIAENIFYGPGYGIMKRHGTKFQSYAYTDSVVYPFLFAGRTYGVEFGDRKARLVSFASSDKGEVASVGLDVSTPYAIGDVADLSVVSNLDKLYIVHHSYKPRTMTISSGALQAPVEVSFVNPVNPSQPSEGDFRTTAVTFNAAGEYPSRQIFYGGRWFLMATDKQPQTIWASRSYDSETESYRFNDFTLTTKVYRKTSATASSYEWENLDLADLGVVYINSDMNGANIRWTYAHRKLLIATGSSIFSDTGDSAITSTVDNAFTTRPALSYGSAGNEAHALGSYVFFVGADNRTVRCIAFNQQYNSYAGSDISASVSQYLSSGIRRICTTDGQMPMLWVLSNDGDLLACYFESGQIIAWSRMTFDGDDTPVWISSMQGGEDGWCSLCVVMDRGGVRTVETLDIASPSTIWTYPSVDCWKRFSSGRVTPFFQGRDMKLLRKFSVKDSGSVRLLAHDISGSEFHDVTPGETDYLGLPYAMVVGTLRSELPANGTSQGARRAVTSVTLRLFNSIGGEIARRPDIDESEQPQRKAIDLIRESKPLLYRYYGKSLYGEAYRLFTGDKSTQFSSAVIDDDRLVIMTEDPFPFCICAIIVKHSITEA